MIFSPSVLVCTVPPASTSSIFFQLLSVSPPDHGPSPLWLQIVSEEVHPPSAPPAVSSHPLPDLQASHSQSSFSSLSTGAQKCLNVSYSATPPPHDVHLCWSRFLHEKQLQFSIIRPFYIQNLNNAFIKYWSNG